MVLEQVGTETLNISFILASSRICLLALLGRSAILHISGTETEDD